MPPAKTTTSKPVKSLAKTASAQAQAKRQRDARRAEALIALVERRKQRITEDFYDIGEALREILRKTLYAALGYATFEELLRARKLMSLAQAKKLIRLVDGIPRQEALALGQEKAYALVAYTAATPEADVPAELVRASAAIAGKPIQKASKREIQEATAKLRSKAPPKTAAAKARQRKEQAVEKGLRALLRSIGVHRADIAVGLQSVVVTFSRKSLDSLLRTG